jgi:DNA repair protein RadA/Sms
VQDVFLNIAGGFKVEDPAIDLAVCASIASSYEDKPIPTHVCFAGEVGLGGEIRAVNRIENRISEAEKLGFKEIYISKYNKKGLDLDKFKMKVITVTKFEDVVNHLFL